MKTSQFQNVKGTAGQTLNLVNSDMFANSNICVSSQPLDWTDDNSTSIWKVDSSRRTRIYGLTTAELTALLDAVREAESIEQFAMKADLKVSDFLKQRWFEALKTCVIDSLESELRTRGNE